MKNPLAGKAGLKNDPDPVTSNMVSAMFCCNIVGTVNPPIIIENWWVSQMVLYWHRQGTLTEGEGSVQLTS